MASFEEWYQAIKKSAEHTEEEEGILQAMHDAEPYIQAMDNKTDELGLTKEEMYVINYITCNSKAEEEKPNIYDYTLLHLTIMAYVHQHKQEVMDLFNPRKRKDFVSKLNAVDWRKLDLDPNQDNIIAFTSNPEPTIENVLETIGFGNYVHLYKTKQQKYRTRAKAAPDAERILSQSLAIPTLSDFQYATSLYTGGSAYIQKFTSIEGLKFQNGKIFFEGGLQAISEAELQNMRTKEGIEELDLTLLRAFYSIILMAFEQTQYKEIKQVITLFVPDLAKYLGLQGNLSKRDIDGIIDKTQAFHNMVGVIHETRNGRPTQSLYSVLNFESYDDKENTISFSSPYMNYVIQTVCDVAIRRYKTGEPKLKKSGEPLRIASHSYLVKSEICKERNKRAVENVFIITALIERAGDNTANIKAGTIIERNPQLQQSLEKIKTGNKGRLLQRTFEKTWELLRTQTRLAEVYEDIQLPDPRNPANIPTLKNLNETVFRFPHKGKKTNT